MPILDQKSVAQLIALRPITPRMRLAIDLNNQRSFAAVEIDNVRTNRVLAAKLQPRLSAAKLLPQHHFWEAHILAELACDIDFGPKHVPHSPSTTLRVVPLPVPGRIKG
jgi:hypothetical protein